jgi:hypothetical protein
MTLIGYRIGATLTDISTSIQTIIHMSKEFNSVSTIEPATYAKNDKIWLTKSAASSAVFPKVSLARSLISRVAIL